MRYKVVREDNLTELESSVNMYIDMGWVPLGGVSHGGPVFHADYYNENLRGFYPNQHEYVQAMIQE